MAVLGLDKFMESMKAASKIWWNLSDQDRQKIIDEKRQKDAAAIKRGCILKYNGIYYTEQQIFDGECPANGTLVNMGYKRLENGKWGK